MQGILAGQPAKGDLLSSLFGEQLKGLDSQVDEVMVGLRCDEATAEPSVLLHDCLGARVSGHGRVVPPDQNMPHGVGMGNMFQGLCLAALPSWNAHNEYVHAVESFSKELVHHCICSAVSSRTTCAFFQEKQLRILQIQALDKYSAWENYVQFFSISDVLQDRP